MEKDRQTERERERERERAEDDKNLILRKKSYQQLTPLITN